MSPELLKELFQKYASGTCTPEESRFLEETFFLYQQDQDAVPSEAEMKAAVTRVREQLADHTRGEVLRRRRRPRFYLLAAAVLVMSISIGFIIWQLEGTAHSPQDIAAVNDIQPGGNRAVLTLEDGQTVDLNEAQSGIVVGDEIRYADGTAVLDESAEKNKPQPVGDLILRTPKGGMYQITLPDGTEVWLNASSELRYPKKFAADARVVEIAGEGYFAVKKDTRRPFIVRTAGQEVWVLGTAFNISAYADDEVTETTLVEGAVKVAGHEAKAERTLRPGQQAKLSHKGLSVHAVDVDEFTAWKEGYFVFNDASIYSILKKFSRWYNIEIDDEIKLTDDLFTGKIPRNATLQSALKIVGNTSGMSFQLTDANKLILSK